MKIKASELSNILTKILLIYQSEFRCNSKISVVRISKGFIDALNSIFYARAKFPIDMKECYIDGKILLDVLLSLGDRNVEFTLDKNALFVRSGKFKIQLALVDDMNFDKAKKSYKRDLVFDIDSETSKICRSIFDVSNNNLNKLYINNGCSICTDGYRVMKFNVDVKGDFVVDWNVFYIISNMSEDAKIVFDDKKCVLEYDDLFYISHRNYDFVSKIIFDKYKIIKNAKSVASFVITPKVKLALDVAQTIANLCLDNVIVLSLSKNELTINSTHDSGLVHNKVSVESNGTFGLSTNLQFVLQMLDICDKYKLDKLEVKELDKSSMLLCLSSKSMEYYISCIKI